MIDNPCHECKIRKKCIEYDSAYLQPVMLTKQLPIAIRPTRPKQKKVSKPRRPRLTHLDEETQCKMGGCNRRAMSTGYCTVCAASRRYYKLKGKPIPTELSQRSIRSRGGK